VTPAEEALRQGYSPEEVNTFLATKAHEAKSAGYSDEEIRAFVKEHVTQQPDFNATPLVQQGQANLAARKSPATLSEALETGWGWSNIALGREALKGPDGKLPAMELGTDTPWQLRLPGQAVGMLADAPSMIAGGMLGAGGGPLTAWAGGFALSQGLRKVFVDAILNNEITTRKDFAERAAGTIWETTKGLITGATTKAVGLAAESSTAALSSLSRAVLPAAAEIAALTEVSARLEGHAPEPQALLDNAVLLGIAKAVMPVSAGARAATVLHETYVKTGMPPEAVVHDAMKGDKNVWQDTLDGRVPDAYKELVETPHSIPTQTQRAEFRTPNLTPEQQAQARAFMDRPFAEIPQMPNEPSRPTHMNYNRIQTTEEASQALAQLSTIYESKIQDVQKSPRSWAKSQTDAAQVLADLLQSDPATVSSFLKGEQPGPSTTAKLLARKELTVGFTEDLMRARAELVMKGDKATPEELAGFLAQVERVSNVQAGFLGQRADIARALNALKSTKREADRSQAIIDAINTYGGPENVGKLVKLLGEYDSPAQAIEFSKRATKATTWEMMVEAWKAGLVSGLRTNEVNFLSTAAFTMLRLPTEAIAATIGALKGHEERVLFAEIPSRILGMTSGIRDGFKVAGAILRTGDNVTGPKTDTFEPKIPGTIGEVIRTPFRFLSASDALLKTVNTQGELYALATKQALSEGYELGSASLFARVTDLAKHPTDEMAERAHAASLRYTFNAPLGPGGKSFSHTVKAWHLEWMFPFISTPGNIFKEMARMTPGMNFAVKEWRADYEAGGARRDRALAEVTIGASIMAAVMVAAANGTITGNGQPDKHMRATDRAAGWKPYAVKMNGAYVDGYLRMAPIGPLIGMTVDGAEFWKYMTGSERDQWAQMLAFAFASNVTNQTFMTGATNFVNVLQDPSRYGQNYFEALASSLVPSIIGQTAAEADPLMREIHGMHDAIIARIPRQREGLFPKRDWTGQPIASPEYLWAGSPFSVSASTGDKVRAEASRIGFATPDIPKSIDVIPGVVLGKLDTIQLTPEQRDVFASESGKKAYAILQREVARPDWDIMPDIMKRRIFETTMKKSRVTTEKELLMGIIASDPSLPARIGASVTKEYTQVPSSKTHDNSPTTR